MSEKNPPHPDRSVRPSSANAGADSTIEILERAQRGDTRAIQVLIERAIPPVRRWARGRLPGYVRQDANTEDVLQDAVLRTLKTVKRLRHTTVGGMQAYLRVGVINRIRDLIRGSKRRGLSVELTDEVVDKELSPLELTLRQEKLATYLEAMSRLRPGDREIIIWRIELGLSVQEIAARLGKSAPAAGMSVTRAVGRLSTALKSSTAPSSTPRSEPS